MKLFRFIVLIIYLSSCSSSNEITPFFKCKLFKELESNSKYHIILIAGQSNTHSGIGMDVKLDTADSRIKQLGRFHDQNFIITDAVEPLNHHTPSQGKIGFGLTFSNLYAELLLNDGDSIFMVPCGYGGTNFKDNWWNKGDTLYNDAVTRVNHILDNYPRSELKAILWHQGESDVSNQNYKDDLDTFIEYIRCDLGNSNIPFILGGMVPYWVEQSEERINQQNIIATTKFRLSRIGYSDPNLPYRIEKEDNLFDEVHFDAKGQRELGKRYFEEYLNIIDFR